MNPSGKKHEEWGVFDVRVSRKKSGTFSSFVSKIFYDHNTLNLRPRLRFRNPIAWGFGIILLAILIFFGVSRFFTRAEVDDFYPTTCLGTWQNAANAAGQPETMTAAKPPFSSDNSAIYAAGAQIFCGGFVPPDSATSGIITNVGLTLVWQIGDAAPASQSMASIVSVISAASTTASVQDASTSIASATIATSVISTAPTSTDDNDAITTTTNTATATATSTPSAPSSSPVTSFLREFIPFALADDVSSTNVATTVVLGPALSADFIPSSTPMASSSSSSSSSDSDAAPADSSTTAASTTPSISSTPSAPGSTTIAAVAPPPPAPDGDFLDVSYTTDGQTWVSVGHVSLANWQAFTVTLPITNWNDLANLQVRVEGIPTTQDPVPPIYLDGMLMEVHYDLPSAIDPNVVATSTDETASSTTAAASSTTSPPPARMTLLDPGAQQTCDVQPFSQTLPLGESASFVVNLHPSIDGIAYDIQLGHLPAGIFASVGAPVGAVAATSSLVFQAATSTEPGSVNIAVIYNEHEADGSLLANFCQVNLDVQ